MKGKAIIALLAVSLLLGMGCAEKKAEKQWVSGIASEEKSECGEWAIATLSDQKFYFEKEAIDLNFTEGDRIRVFGQASAKGKCTAIAPEKAEFERRAAGIVGEGDTVTVELTEWIKSTGEVYHTSVEEIGEDANLGKEQYNPIKFKAGSGEFISEVAGGNINPAVAKGVLGMRIGEDKNFEIPPGEGFEKFDKEKVVPIDKNQWFGQSDTIPKKDTPVIINGVIGRVRGHDENKVYVDFNPSYAGETVVFWVKIIDIAKKP